MSNFGHSIEEYIDKLQLIFLGEKNAIFVLSFQFHSTPVTSQLVTESMKNDIQKLEKEMTQESSMKKDIQKLKKEMTQEADFSSIQIPEKWLDGFLREVDLTGSDFQEIIERSKKDAKEVFNLKSAWKDSTFSDFHGIDDKSSTKIGQFLITKLKNKITGKEMIRACELFTQYVGKMLFNNNYEISLFRVTRFFNLALGVK